MKCTDFENNVNDFIDDELNKVSSKDMKNHIDKCDECKQLYEELVELKVMLSNVEELELPDKFAEELHEKLVEVSNENKVVSISDRFRKYKVIASVAAVVLISVVAIRATDFSMNFGVGSDDAADMAVNEAFEVELANDMAVEETTESASYEATEESAEEEVVEAVAEVMAADAAPAEAKLFGRAISNLNIETREEVTIEIASSTEVVSAYLEDSSFTVHFSESVGELSVLTENNKVTDFIQDIKSNFNVVLEYYVDYYEEIEEMKLLAVRYEDSIVDLSNRVENETNEEEKTNLENELKYVSSMYDDIRASLKGVSVNEGLTKIILRIISE